MYVVMCGLVVNFFPAGGVRRDLPAGGIARSRTGPVVGGYRDDEQ